MTIVIISSSTSPQQNVRISNGIIIESPFHRGQQGRWSRWSRWPQWSRWGRWSWWQLIHVVPIDVLEIDLDPIVLWEIIQRTSCIHGGFASFYLERRLLQHDTLYFESYLESESLPQGNSSSLQPLGMPLYPRLIIRFSSSTMQAPT